MADLLTFASKRQKSGRAGSYALAVAEMWVARGRLPNRMGSENFDREWDVILDDDGALCLMPRRTEEPPFAIMAEDGGYLVLICDSEDMDELGPFATVEAALAGIGTWLVLPQAMVG